MRPIILVGGGGHCVSCIDVIEQTGRFRIAGILDREVKVGESLLGYSYVGTDADISTFLEQGCMFLITIGHIREVSVRIRLYELLTGLHAPIATVISPRAYVSSRADVGNGTIIMHDALVNAHAKIGNNCIINTKALVEHDAVVEDHCHIATGGIVNGGVVIRTGTFFGSGAVSQEYSQSNRGDFIKAGSLLKRSH